MHISSYSHLGKYLHDNDGYYPTDDKEEKQHDAFICSHLHHGYVLKN